MKNLISFCIAALFGMVVLGVPMAGWGLNIVKFAHCDFESPYRAEVLRGASIIIWPIGCLVGYLTIND